MAPKTRAKSVKAGAQDSKNTKRCGHCGASVRSEGTETKLQDTANAAANVSAESLDSIEPVDGVDPWESVEVSAQVALPEWNGRRRRSGLRMRDELEVADFLVTEDFCRKWASGSVAATMVQMKKDVNYFTPRQKSVSSKAGKDSTGPSFVGTCGIPIQAYSTGMASSSLQPKFRKYYC